MKHIITFAAALVLVTAVARPGFPQGVPVALQTAAACAPQVASPVPVPDDALRLIGVQDSVGRALFGNGDLVIVGGGTARGVQLGQQFFVRRATRERGIFGPRALNTAGRIRVVAVNESTTIALVEVACDGLLAGDFLEPYVEPVLPLDVNRVDTTGQPDFSAPGRILFGDNERSTGAVGDFMVTDVGAQEGAVPGLRFAIYRDVGTPGAPLASVGEAVVISAAPETSVVRLTLTRDAIYTGDLLMRRRR
jgi:hypothetical protein